MIQFKIRLTGAEEALADFDRREANAHRYVEEDLEWFGKTAEEQMIQTHTFQNRTFRLEGSIGYDLYVFQGNFAHLAVFALAPYASQVEFGHPGPPPARPYPFFWPVFYNLSPELLARMDESWNRGWAGL